MELYVNCDHNCTIVLNRSQSVVIARKQFIQQNTSNFFRKNQKKNNRNRKRIHSIKNSRKIKSFIFPLRSKKSEFRRSDRYVRSLMHFKINFVVNFFLLNLTLKILNLSQICQEESNRIKRDQKGFLCSIKGFKFKLKGRMISSCLQAQIWQKI